MKTYALTKAERIRHPYDFRRIRNLKFRIKGTNITLNFCRNSLLFNRIGFASAKRKLLAHQRNRIKRVLRESYRVNKNSFKNGFDIILTYIGSCIKTSTPLISKELSLLAKKAGLLK